MMFLFLICFIKSDWNFLRIKKTKDSKEIRKLLNKYINKIVCIKSIEKYKMHSSCNGHK